MMPTEDPKHMIQAEEETSLKRRYARNPEPSAQPQPQIQFEMQDAFGEKAPASPQNYYGGAPNMQMEDEEDEERYELDDEDDAIFPGGPDESLVLSWKKQYNNRVYLAEINDDAFIIRTLTRYEYKQIVALPNIDPLQREEIICETCILWPQNITWQNFANMDSGLPAIVAEQILDKSGFTKNVRVSLL